MNDSEEFLDEAFTETPVKNVFFFNNPEEMLKPWISNPMFFEIAIIHGITFIFGFIGNVIVLFALAGDRRVRNATNTFLVSLAAGDLLMLCVHGPLETYSHFVIQWDENSIVCKMAKYAELLSAMSSVLNLLAVTMERFIVIMFPMKSRTLCTTANTFRAVLVVWLLAIALALPVVFTTGTFQYQFTNNVTSVTLNYCDYSLKHPNVVLYNFLVVFAVPSSLLTICYTFVIKELWASTRQMNILTQQESFSAKRGSTRKTQGCLTETKETDSQHFIEKRSRRRINSRLRKTFSHNRRATNNSNRDDPNNARKQVPISTVLLRQTGVIKMLILVVIMFFVCWGPRLTMEVLSKYGQLPFNNVVYRMRMTFNVMTFIHGCMNPFIYCFMSKNFRVRFLKFLRLFGMRMKNDEAKNSDIILIPIPSQRNVQRNLDARTYRDRSSVTKQTDLECTIEACSNLKPDPIQIA